MRILTVNSKCVISIFAIFLTVLNAQVASYGQNGATPASQPETIWSATMTVGAWRYTQGDGRSGTGYGYDASKNIGSFSNRTFTYRGTTYRIDAFYYTRLDGYRPSSSVIINLNRNGPSHCDSNVLDVYVNSAWESLSTGADSPKMTCSNSLNRSNTNWSVGQQISLTIRATPKPPDVSILTAIYEENQVNLSWETPCDGGKDIIRHEYRQKTRSGTFGSWTSIPNSGAGGVNVAGYTITSLNNPEQYVFEVRAVNEIGEGSSAAVSHSDRTPQVTEAILNVVKLGDPNVSSFADITDSHLAGITALYLGFRNITALKSGDFAGLIGMTELRLPNNQLTSLPADIFDGLTALTTLRLNGNQLTSLPDGIFEGLTGLTTLYLSNNAVNPLPLTVSLEKVGTDQFKALAPAGAPFDIVLPIRLTNGSIGGGASSITIPKGNTESISLTVARTPDTTGDVTVDIGTLPSLPSSHIGYALVKSDDLPLNYPLPEIHTLLGGRTPQVAEAILNVVKIDYPNVSTYADITAEHLAAPTALYLEGKNITTLKSGDFDGLTGLTELRLWSNQLTSLPEDIFNELTALRTLRFGYNQLTTLPADLFDGLTSLTYLAMIGNQLSSLPDGIFEGLTGLTTLYMGQNAVDPLPITVSIEKVGDSKFKAVAPTGAPFEIVLPLTVTDGSINGGTTTVTIPAGSIESEVLTVTRTPGAAYAVSVDISSLPSLPAGHSGYSLVKSDDLPLVFTELGGIEFLPVSQRTEQVRNAIVKAVPGITAFEDITRAHLESITSLILGTPPSPFVTPDPDTSGTTALQAGDFHGLISLAGLSIVEDNLSDLPSDVFDGLVSLEVLTLSGIFTDLPVDIFDELVPLKTLSLAGNFSSLPSGVFDNLNSLETLILGSPQLNNLQQDIFDELSSLTSLFLLSQLNTLPENIFQNLPKLTKLAVGTKLTTLPSNIFKGLTTLTSLNLEGDGNVPLPLKVALEKVGNDQFKAVVPTGAPYDIVLPIIISNGVIKDGKSSLTIPTGSVESETLTVLRAPGTTLDVTVNIGTLPNLPEGHSGYTLVKPTDLPLIYSSVEVSGFVSVSDRTPQVRDVIVAAVPGISSAADVTPAHLAAITTLDLSGQSITSLAEYDFSGMSGLRNLFLHDNQLTGLPVGVFSGLSALHKLTLFHNQLTELPDGIFSGLSALYGLALSENQLTELPAGVFAGLSSLGLLELTDTQLTELPDAVFNGLSSLEILYLNNNALVSLPAGIFNGLSALYTLDVSSNQLTELPDGIFSGLSALTELDLSDNAVNPLPLTVSLEKVADGQFKAVAPTGAPSDIALSIHVVNGSIPSGETTIVIPKGNVESDVLTVARPPSTTLFTSVNIGTLPSLPVNHSGYTLVKSTDLPITVIEGNIPDTAVLTLTVGAGPGAALRGYNPHSLPEWNFGSLSFRTFVFKGVSYTLYRLYYNVAGKRLEFQTSPMARGFELYLDAHLLRSFSALDYNLHQWNDVNLNWSVGQKVQVRIVESTPMPPEAPTNLTATPSYEKVTLSWELPSNADPTTLPVTEYELRVSNDGGTTWNPDWNIISRSRSGQSNRTSCTVGDRDRNPNERDIIDIDLINGTSYTFEIRARGGDGRGDAARITVIPEGVTSASDRTPQVAEAILDVVRLSDPNVSSFAEITDSHLVGITTLYLNGRNITSLKSGDFEGLTALEELRLYGNQISSLPGDIFEGLSALKTLNLFNNRLSSLPDGLFEGLTSLTTLRLNGNAVTLIPLTVSLEKIGTDQFKAVAPAGATFDIVVPINVINGRIKEGSSSLTIPQGSVESGTLTITRIPGTTANVTVNIGTLPRVPSNHLGYGLVKSANLPLSYPLSEVSTLIGSRTQQVKDAIVLQAGVNSESDVTEAHLAAITSLDLQRKSITSLKSGDFAGLTRLTSLDLSLNSLETLPLGIFDNLTSLTSLSLWYNRLNSLRAGVFDDLTNLTTLSLQQNNLTSLPSGAFDKLTSLTNLELLFNNFNALSSDIFNNLISLKKLGVSGNYTTLSSGIFDKLKLLSELSLQDSKLTELPIGIFDNLASLQRLTLHNNQLTTLPSGIFDKLTSLTSLSLSNNQITELPSSIFKGLSLFNLFLNNNKLTTLQDNIFKGLPFGLNSSLRLQDNPVDPLPITISLIKVAEGQVKATVHTGAPYVIALPISVVNGSITGGATTITIPAGSVESEVFTVSKTADTTDAVSVDIGTLPDLPHNHSGYALVKSTDLPITVIDTVDIVTNNNPVFTEGENATRTVAENTAAGSNIGGAVTATDQEANDTLTYSLSGLDAFAFDIDSSTGQLLTKTSLNYEKKSSYLVIISVSDGNGGTDNITVTINIIDIDEQQTAITTYNVGDDITTLPNGLWRPDTAANGVSFVGSAGKVTITFANGGFIEKDGITYTCVTADGCQIVGSEVTKGTIEATTNDFVPTPSNNAPVFTDGDTTTRSITENAAANTNIGTPVSATDADNDTLTYSLGGTDAATFSINTSTGQLSTFAALDYETKSTYTVTITVDDNELSDTIKVIINVINVNEPVISAGFVPVADRTPEVRDAIVAAVPNVSNAAYVTEAQVAAITSLNLRIKGITSLKTGDFSGMTSLSNLNLFRNQLSSLPHGIFDGLISLRTLRLGGNAVNPLPLFVSLHQVEKGQFKAVISTGAPFNIVLPIIVTNGSISSGATRVTIPQGSMESATFTVIGTSAKVAFGTLPGLPPNHYGYTLELFNICPLRTQQVADTIAKVVGVIDCSAVTEIDLTTITRLDLSGMSITELKAGDFNGMFSLNTLYLENNELTSLPNGIFDDLVSLQFLSLNENKLTSLPSDLFSNLTSLTSLDIFNNDINSLPDGVFNGLSSLSSLSINDNNLTSLSGGIFDGLPHISSINLSKNKLTDLPNGIFEGLTQLSQLNLSANSVEPLPLTISLQKVGTNQFKAVFTTGAPFAIHLPVKITNGKVHNGATTISIPIGKVESGPLTVTRTGGSAAVIVDIGTPLPSLPSTHNGYVLVKSTTLPLEVLPLLNSPPMFTEGVNTIRTIAENTATDTNIGDAVTATDQDAKDSLTYTLGGTDAASFDVDSKTGQLKTKASLDYETKTSYSITITVSDGTLTDTITVTINITDIDENRAPVFTEGRTATRTVPENTAAGSNIGDAISATDPDDDTLIYSLNGTDAGAFDIDSNTGQLKTKTALDYETKVSYSITITVSDGSLTDIITVTINVTDIGENVNPVFTEGSSTTRSIAENTASGINIGNAISATDADNDTLTYTLSGTAASSFSIDSSTGQLQTSAALDYETKSSYTVTVSVSDGNGGTDSITVTINVTDVDEDAPVTNNAPEFSDGSSTTRSIAENTSSGVNIGNAISATDADNDTLTYTLSGTDASSFSIDSSTGQLQTSAALDYETKSSYTVTVSVSDGNGGTDSITITINVTDVDEDTTTTIIYNVGDTIPNFPFPSGTFNFGNILTFNDTVYTCISDEECTITNGQVTQGTIEDSSGDGEDTTDEDTSNNAPVFTDGDSTTRSIAENTASGINIGNAISATDADNDTLTYTLSGTAASSFSIDSSTGQLQTSAALDYETKSSYTVTVSVSDGNGGTDSITITINVTDVDEDADVDEDTDVDEDADSPISLSNLTCSGNVIFGNLLSVRIGVTVTANRRVRITVIEGFINGDSIGINPLFRILNAGETTTISVSGTWNHDGSDDPECSANVEWETFAAPAAPSVPINTVLLPNYPNPFNPETWIPYELSKSAEVTLTIYNMRGQMIRQLKLGHKPAGVYRNRSRAIHWDGRNNIGEKVATGVYFYQLTAGDFTATRKMLILK